MKSYNNPQPGHNLDENSVSDDDAVNDYENEEKKQLIVKRDTHKIKTNPKYKCKDEASECLDGDENDETKQHEDF